MSPMQRLYYGRHRLSFRAGTYLALIRMMGITHLVTALYGHAQIASQTHTRLARTRQTLLDLIVHGFDSEPGRAAIHRLRAVHAHLAAQPEDFRYVLGTFFLEPMRWNAAYGRLQLVPEEIAQLLAFWLQVGKAMGLTNLPATLAEWESTQVEYEACHLRHTLQGERLARLCLRDVVKLTVPRGLRMPFRQLMLATMEPLVRTALALPRAHWVAQMAVRVVLAAKRNRPS
jgi:hypothetical protein